MRAYRMLLLTVAGLGVAACLSLGAADDKKVFPQPSTEVPTSFSPLVINGGWKDDKDNPVDRHHSVVCHFGLKPVVLVFAKDPKDETVLDFLKKLDAKIEEHQGVYLSGCAIFLVFDDKRDKADLSPKDLIALANEKEDLVKTVKNNTGGLKHVLVGLDAPAGPKGYAIGEKTYVAIILYDKFKVAASHLYEIGDKENKEAGFGPKAEAQVLKEIDSWAAGLKRKPGAVKKNR